MKINMDATGGPNDAGEWIFGCCLTNFHQVSHNTDYSLVYMGTAIYSPFDECRCTWWISLFQKGECIMNLIAQSCTLKVPDLWFLVSYKKEIFSYGNLMISFGT